MSKVHLGKLYTSSGVNSQIAQSSKFAAFVYHSLLRHATGDWGDVSPTDCQENNLSVKKGWRILSAYSSGESRIWIITEADRSATVILYPEEY
jgi:hypothetical protein